LSHPLKRRMLVTSVTAAAIIALTPMATLAAARTVQLPKPRSTAVVPNVSAGGLRLGAKLLPLPRGWRHPNKCDRTHGFQLCAWTSHPEPHMGLAHPATGPLVLVGAYHNQIVQSSSPTTASTRHTRSSQAGAPAGESGSDPGSAP
jgi:hypothetical protein